MDHRVLGSSGLVVSPICLGSMTFGSPVSETDTIRLVHEAIDLGINFIDTANSYEGYDRVVGSAGGVAEEILGKALHDRRDRVVLTTKVGAPLGSGPQDCGLSATHILRELDASLRRLNTDFVDVYFIHWPDRMTPLETTMQALAQVVRQGKARYVAVSNHSAAQLCEFLWLADRSGGPRIAASQIPFSLMHREFQNDLEFCGRHQIGITAYQSLQGGLLTGKYRRGQPPPSGSRAAEKPGWISAEFNDALFDRLEAFEALASELGVPPAQYAMAWTLAQPAMTSLVVGAKRIEQVQDAISASEVTIPDEHFDSVNKIYPPPWKQGDPIRP